MITITKDNVKKYSFDQNEVQTLQEIELGIASFTRAVQGMQINKQILLANAYKRLGIDGDAPEGFERSIQYNPYKNEIIVTDKQKETTIITAKK